MRHRGQVAHHGLTVMIVALDRELRGDVADGATLAALIALRTEKTLLQCVAPILGRGREIRHGEASCQGKGAPCGTLDFRRR
jgi:hypothetical protein